MSVTTEDPFVAQAEAAADFLSHYGVKGMKWGVRKGGVSGGRSKSGAVKEAASEDAERVGGLKTRAKTQKTTKMLSNKELQDAIKRMQLEQQFSQLSGNIDKTTAQKAKMFVTGMVQTSGKQGAQQLANEKTKKQFEKAFDFAVKKGMGV